MKLNKKGAALMQVLLVALILSGIATMLLRASLSRTTSARKTRRTVSAQVLIQTCMAEVNALWGAKTPEAYYRDMQGDSNGPYMYCKTVNANGGCDAAEPTYTCTIDNPYASTDFKVVASFVKDGDDWKLQYAITQGGDYL